MTFVGLVMCSAVSFLVALIISTTCIFTLCPSFNLKPLERQQLYEIWPYMGSLISCPCLYIPIYSCFDSSCSKVHLNIDLRMYGSFRQSYLLMKSINSSQCLTSVYEALSCLGARTISLPFDIQWIITVNFVFGNSGRLLLAFLPARSPKSVADRLWPHLATCLASGISLAHCFKNISTLCSRIHSALSKLTNGSQVTNFAKTSATDVSQCRGPSRTCLNQFGHLIMDRCLFSRNPAMHTFIHLLNALMLGCPILLANCFKENSIFFWLIRGLPSAPANSDESSLSSAASYSLYDNSGNRGKCAIPVTSVPCGSTGGWNRFVGRLIGCLTGAPEEGWGGSVEPEDVDWLSGWFPGGPGGTIGAPGDDGPCPGNWKGGNIWDLQYPPWCRSYPCHGGP